MAKKMLVLPGDGVGPEVTSSAVRIVNHVAGDKMEMIYGDVGQSAFVKTSEYLPAETVALATEADAIIAGVVFDAHSDRSYQNPIGVLKKQLNLYAVVRKFFPLCKKVGAQGLDLVIVSGNQDVLSNITETESLDGVDTHKYISTTSTKKLFQKTMKVASMLERKKITCAHKATLFPLLDGIFIDTFYKELAGTSFLLNDMEVDDIASQIVMDFPSLDVIVSTDLYGTVLSGVAAGMVGGSYLTPVGNIGDVSGLFEPMHGPNPKTTEPGYVNPTSAILSGAMALNRIGMREEAEKIRKAVRHVYGTGKVTPDVGGTATSREFTNSLLDVLSNK